MPSIDNAGESATPPAPVASDENLTTTVAPEGVTPDSPPAADVPAADSSPADGVDRQSLLDVTRAALGRKQATGETGSPAQNDQAGAPAPDPTPTPPKTPEADEAPATGDDAFADADTLEFGKHPRFKSLLSQWNRDKGPAEQQRKIEAFMQEHSLSPVEAAEALKLAAILAHSRRGSLDHAKLFLQDMGPVLASIRQLVGEEIAPDLQERLADGAVDEPTAKELTAARRQREAAEKRASENEQRQQQDRQGALVRQVTQAVSEWDAGARARDPDFSRKEDLIRSTIKRIAAEEGPPANAQAAVALAERAYAAVNKAFDGLVRAPASPPPPPPRRIGSGAPPRSQVRPQALTPVEITRLALQRTAS